MNGSPLRRQTSRKRFAVPALLLASPPGKPGDPSSSQGCFDATKTMLSSGFPKDFSSLPQAADNSTKKGAGKYLRDLEYCWFILYKEQVIPLSRDRF
jgi:hypothetical protein